MWIIFIGAPCTVNLSTECCFIAAYVELATTGTAATTIT